MWRRTANLLLSFREQEQDWGAGMWGLLGTGSPRAVGRAAVLIPEQEKCRRLWEAEGEEKAMEDEHEEEE